MKKIVMIASSSNCDAKCSNHESPAGASRSSVSRLIRRGLAALSGGSLLLAAFALPGCMADADSSSGDEETSGVESNALTSSVTIYKDANYSGSSQTLSPGVYNVGDLTIGNDALTSLTIPSGWTVRLYQDKNWDGTVQSLTSNIADLSTLGFNDETSSIVVQGSGSDANVILFKDSNYSGTAQSIVAGEYNVDDLTIGNDALTSLLVPSGWTVVLYEDKNYSGTAVSITASTANLGTSNSFNDKTSSIKALSY